MNCDQVRNALMAADVPFTTEEFDDAVADHLRGCSSCRALSSALEHQIGELLSVYQGLNPRTSAEQVADVALRKAPLLQVSTGRSPVGKTFQAGRAGRRSRRGALAAGLLGVAAAAAAIVFAATRHTGSAAPDVAQRVPIEVQVPENQNAIVFETRNPNITVVWIYSGD
jgi:hypothetical protein